MADLMDVLISAVMPGFLTAVFAILFLPILNILFGSSIYKIQKDIITWLMLRRLGKVKLSGLLHPGESFSLGGLSLQFDRVLPHEGVLKLSSVSVSVVRKDGNVVNRLRLYLGYNRVPIAVYGPTQEKTVAFYPLVITEITDDLVEVIVGEKRG